MYQFQAIGTRMILAQYEAMTHLRQNQEIENSEDGTALTFRISDTFSSTITAHARVDAATRHARSA